MKVLEETPQKNVVGKTVIQLSKGEVITLRFLGKLKRVAARLKNRITERNFRFLSMSNPALVLDKSKTEWKILFGDTLIPAEFVFGSELIASVIVAQNPRLIDVERLEKEFPSAFLSCVSPGAFHLRLNIKK